MAPRKKKAAAAIVVSDDDQVVDVPAAPKRSMRKRKQINYTERGEDDSDIAPEAPKKRAKVTAKSEVVTAEAAVSEGSKVAVTKAEATESEVVVIDDSSEEEKPKRKPKSRAKVGGEARQREFQEELSDRFLASKARALSQPLRFIDRFRTDTSKAPEEEFTIAGNSGKDYIVKITHVPKCSCADHAFRRSICKHIIYTMVNVLKVPEDSHILYQLALTTTELHEIFENAPAAPFVAVDAEHTEPNRKPIDGECPICYMEFKPEKEAIVHCKAHCGNNVHKDCIATWLKAQLKSFAKATCPYCRMDWVD